MSVKTTRLVSIADLKAYPGNARVHDVPAIQQSLRANGQYRAVVVRQPSMTILAGHGTVEAAKAEGWKKLLAHLVDVDDEQARLIVLADNRTAELGGYDDRLLVALLERSPVLEGSGWDESTLAALKVSLKDRRGEDTEPMARPKKARTKLGELVELGPHRLLCASSTDHAEVARLMDGQLARMVLADPPYNVNYKGGTNSRSGAAIKRNRADAYPDQRGDYAGWLAEVLKAAGGASDEHAALHLWHADCEARAVLAAIDASGWVDRSIIVWEKGSIKGGLHQAMKQYRTQFEPMVYGHKRGKAPRWFGPKNESTVWHEPPPRANPLHPTMKPVPLYERSLSNHTEPGDPVLEMFGGSGTTLIAAENLGRVAFLMEVDPHYCDVIRDRYERHVA